MFDIDIMEKDWKQNSFCLSDKQIMEIFEEEGITTAEYDKEVTEFRNSLPKCPTAEERLLAAIFHDEKMEEQIKTLNEEVKTMYETKYPQKKHLSKSSQMKIVEGCMDVVFNRSRYWYKYFKEKVSMENLYYICLHSLFDCVKYCVHYSNKPCFRSYVNKSIEKNIIKNVAKWEHISYRNAYYIINKLGRIEDHFNSEYESELKFDYEKEIPFTPSYIYEKIKNDSYNVDYVGKISSKEFMSDYEDALNELTKDEKKVMELLYDINGECDLTIGKISEFLVVEPEITEKLKKNAIKKLRKDIRFNKYKKDSV